MVRCADTAFAQSRTRSPENSRGSAYGTSAGRFKRRLRLRGIGRMLAGARPAGQRTSPFRARLRRSFTGCVAGRQRVRAPATPQTIGKPIVKLAEVLLLK